MSNLQYLNHRNISFDSRGNEKHVVNLLRPWFHSWLCLWIRLFLEPWGIRGRQWSTSSLISKPSRSITLCQIYEENQQVVICNLIATAYQYRSPFIDCFEFVLNNYKPLPKVWYSLPTICSHRQTHISQSSTGLVHKVSISMTVEPMSSYHLSCMPSNTTLSTPS